MITLMIKSLACALVSSVVLASTAFAGPGGGGGGGSSAPAEGAVMSSDLPLYNTIEEATQALMEEFGEDETCPYNVDVPSIVVPIAADRFLYGYAFVTPRICLTRGVSETRFIEGLHFMVDAMVREAHRHPFTIDASGEVMRDDTQEHLLEALLSVAEDGQIDRLDLLGSDIRPIQ